MDLVRRKLNRPSPPRLEFDADWSGTAWPETCRALLPEHLWLGDDHLRAEAPCEQGSRWLALRDLILGTRGDYMSLLGLVEHARQLGRPIEAGDVGSSGHPFYRRLSVLPARSELRLVQVGRWSDHGCAHPSFVGVGTILDFELEARRQFVLETDRHLWSQRSQGGSEWESGISWGALASAAVIVPVDHPYARDDAAVAAALERVSTAAHSAA